MKVNKIILLAFFCIISLIKAQDQPESILSMPNPIEFDGTEFYLVWSKQASKTLYREQYLPSDQRIENFTQLLDFSYFNKNIDIELAVRQKVESIQKIEDSDKYARVNVTENPTGTEFIVDYFSSNSPEEGEPYIEYALDRFISTQNGDHESFLIVTYAKRMYGDLKSNFKSLSRQRNHLMTTMIEYKVPEINVATTP